VLDIYAANEVGVIAGECPVTEGVLHVNADVQITEATRGEKTLSTRQIGPDDLEIAVVPAKSWTPDVGDAIVRDFRGRLGDSFGYGLRICDEIPLSPGGKLQTIIAMPDRRT
jgi:hypothetical protein